MTSSTNRIALVTGGSRGLGKSMALHLAQKGFDLILTYHSKESEANEVVKAIKDMGKKALALQLDVSDSKTFDHFVGEVRTHIQADFGSEQIHALVNNAGVGNYASFESTTEEQFDNMVNIHLKATFFLTQKMLPVLANGGAIVNLSSGLARFSYPNYSAYAIMKAGIESLTRYQALELGARKIRVNTVAPGAIETDFGGGAVRDNKDLNAMIAGSTALGRVGLPDDVGSVVAFLCSDESQWVNAQRIEVAGGVHI